MSRILVTGANGFLGSHIVKQALGAGLTVRGSVRSAEKAAELKKVFPSNNFEAVVVADAVTGDYTEAFKGVSSLIHVASPFFIPDGAFDPKKDMLEPAIDGTLSALRAAKKAGVNRIVVTSSVGAIPSNPDLLHADTTYGADDWLPFNYDMAVSGQLPPFAVYITSKKLAEQAAWDFAKENPEIKLTTVCPAVVYGPTIHPIKSMKAINASNAPIYALLNGTFIPDIAPVYCDVVGTADVHVKALQSDSTIGKRVLFIKGGASPYEFLSIIHKKRPELASRLAPLPAEDPMKGKPISRFDSSIAKEELGVPGLELEDMVLQTVDDLLRLEKELGAN
ncbi:hypothetical protein GYMLUDRAFT_247186 [Collybiopsis luxurians FD-317 M1]|uniref:NAD-dependent epimerase/dehydratase domain-containing protein n=1 Tax=Collybiopsis luxurians FD-317 M1 TaxID=944289 RepID=A0A0D0C463_9AGAR|nr:hypothetical protein GYMLUDRAFT_247186 [Collybiopsis luxurians FD-317 M1]